MGVTGESVRYRPDIDGLRAVAVLSVVVFHAFPDTLPGGFIGVDVFFVISGYLISSLLFADLQAGRFGFAAFYGRRVRRLFPALILVLAAAYAFGWIALLAGEFEQLGRHVAASAGFVSNFVLWGEAGYFDNVGVSKPLLHLWSLGIEEQFYLAWPLLLWATWKARVPMVAVLAVVTAGSFLLNLRGVAADPVATFYAPWTRLWELSAGGLLGWVSWRARAPSPGPVRHALALAGAALLAFGLYRIDTEVPFPGAWAAVPVFATLLLLGAGPQAWLNRVLLSPRPVVWIGKVSYPFYLWHWPLLSFAWIVQGEAPAAGVRLALLAVALLLAAATYHLLERPLRFAARRRSTTLALVLGMAIVGYAGYHTQAHQGLGFRVARFEAISRAAGEWEFPGSMSTLTVDERTIHVLPSERGTFTLFVGDSNIDQYYSRLEELVRTAPAGTRGLMFATSGGCLPIPGSPYDDEHARCIGLAETAARLAEGDPRIEAVVIGAQWNQYLSDGAALTESFGRGSAAYDLALRRLGDYIERFRRAGKRVYLVLNMPSGKELDPRYMARRSFEDFPRILQIRAGGLPRASLVERHGPVQDDLARVAQASGATVIRPIEALCPEGFCPSVDAAGIPLYKDDSHLRPGFVRTGVRFLDPTVTP